MTIKEIIVVIIAFIFIFGSLFFITSCAYSQETMTAMSKCQDPSTLTPQLKKAYEELKEAFEGVEGVTIRIRFVVRSFLYVNITTFLIGVRMTKTARIF